ncbi:MULTISPECIES: DUF475 domain-containing protein [unclassified Gordonia (in: high G+C Gram-positive bacteria)]|uniref:DUF475 domain-containing protein n=1 Tax=unclassified Gordonia (in: high G+C Gram-positive bacteria) TaxID=2657482 RepID=UPI001CFB90F8|nr:MULTISPECIES: DUF475 domain-containing protein [unclassified Gordonia (in: high G+C Gram-positive bacteria)]UCZ90665.1 DUF475 domain-containing protein [Gordonia sp. WA4-43]WGJ87723.1 DUF475 domain-containing protein [Gordonia sp. SMJS1]
MTARIFAPSLVVTLVALVVAYLYLGWTGLALCAILGVLEVSLSFDNAVINATILERMSAFWQKMFLTVGVLIAVFGMRLLFPLVIVWITGGLNPVEALDLAMNPPPEGQTHFADGQPSYETILTEAHPQIAAFGGMFLLLLFLNFVLTERPQTWLTWLEKPLATLGKLDQLAVVLAALALVLTAEFLAPDESRATVLIAGILGMVTYITVDGLSSLFMAEPESDEPESDATESGGPGSHRSGSNGSGPHPVTVATGKAGFFLFLYLELLDASFSFDGVIGAFAITSDPIIIALGLGFIGAMFVRSITIYLVRKGTLGEYRYLEHGAHWAIGALAAILLISIEIEINEVITGLVGVAFIGASLASSIRANRREARAGTGDRLAV